MSCIACVAKGNNGIGYGGQLCYVLQGDLRHFREITMGCPIIMGSKTFKSLPGGALPGRLNIVISKQDPKEFKWCTVFPSLTEALNFLIKMKIQTKAFIVGGEQVYKEALPYVSELYITEVDDTPSADRFFPNYYNGEWKEEKRDTNIRDFNTGLRYDFIKFKRVPILQ